MISAAPHVQNHVQEDVVPGLNWPQHVARYRQDWESSSRASGVSAGTGTAARLE